MGENSQYYIELEAKLKKKTQSIKKKLPAYTKTYFNNCELSYQPKTVVAYAEDIFTFYSFLKEKNPLYRETNIKDISLEDLDKLTFEDINDYQSYLKFNEGKHYHNSGQVGINRKMSSLRNFFSFLCTNEYIKNDPTVRASKGKRKKDHEIIRMNPDEVAELIKAVENTVLPSKRARSASSKTALRDMAIVTLLLNTGIRVSECVGLDLDDVNFNENTIRIVRKGGSSSVIYFKDNVAMALSDYILHERHTLIHDDKERALFISMAHRRMTARSIEYMIKKFSQEAVQGKKISPHKLRSTYGTALYKVSGDIYLVADVLGHKNVNTTVKHYAAMDEEHRKQAAQFDPYKG